jgi:hypothetical protein
MANYIPDYMVIDGTIWSLGFGSVETAGYWNSTWGYALDQSFIKNDL